MTDLVRVLLALPRPSALGGPARTADARLLDPWLARETVRTAIGLNTWQGVEYIDRDAFEDMLRWAVRLDAIDAAVRRSARPRRPAQTAGRACSGCCRERRLPGRSRCRADAGRPTAAPKRRRRARDPARATRAGSAEGATSAASRGR